MATTTPTEKIPNLTEAPDKGKFLVRYTKPVESTDGTDTPATSTAQYTMVLKVTSEGEYTAPLFNLDDGSIQSTAYTLLANRRGKLREKLVQENEEVELVLG